MNGYGEARKFLLFCIVGGSGVAVNLGVFWLALRALGGANSWRTNAAAVAGWLVSVATNFLLNERITFHADAQAWHSTRTARLMRYYAAAATGLVVQLIVLNALLWLLPRLPAPQGRAWTAIAWAQVLAERVLASNLAGIGLGTIANYWLARKWVFR